MRKQRLVEPNSKLEKQFFIRFCVLTVCILAPLVIVDCVYDPPMYSIERIVLCGLALCVTLICWRIFLHPIIELDKVDKQKKIEQLSFNDRLIYNIQTTKSRVREYSARSSIWVGLAVTFVILPITSMRDDYWISLFGALLLADSVWHILRARKHYQSYTEACDEYGCQPTDIRYFYSRGMIMQILWCWLPIILIKSTLWGLIPLAVIVVMVVLAIHWNKLGKSEDL